MWQVENTTPFGAAGNWTRDRDGAEVWIVAVRAAFTILPNGSTTIAEEQIPPIMAPVHRGDPATTSLIYDSDFYLTKPTTDILLHGHAYAPEGKPAKHVDVSMQVGTVRKSLRVSGDRSQQSVLSGSTEPFVKMPIIYERAYGGHEPAPPKNPERPRFAPRNPIGVGFAPLEGQPGPNISFPGVSLSITTPSAGFGPIPPHWEPRSKYAGTYDEAWQKNRSPLFPDDLDDRFFLCSPEDQRPADYLRGGEPVSLLNLTLSGKLAFVLPKLAFRFSTFFRGKPTRTHRANLYSVILEPDFPRVVMVWHSTLPAHVDVLRLMETRVTQLQVINPPPGSVPIGTETLGEEEEPT